MQTRKELIGALTYGGNERDGFDWRGGFRQGVLCVCDRERGGWSALFQWFFPSVG